MRLRNNKVAKRLGTKALAGVLAIGLIISTPAAALADGGAETAGTQSTASQTPAAQAEKLQAKSVDGKDTLTDVSGIRFEHCEQSVRVVEKIEKDGKGLNLTKEVRDGILNHRTSGTPHTLEGKVVRLSDKIAYINHDIDDAIRGKIITENDIPKAYTEILGKSTKERLNSEE